MLASYFYQGDVPTPEALLDMAREALVAVAREDLDSDTCQSLVDGLAKAWEAARAHERGEEDSEEACFATAAKAERAYIERALRVYTPHVKRAFPHYDPDDGTIWWPEGLRYRTGWPKAFLLALASTLGEIEADRTVFMFREMQKLDAERKGADAAKGAS